MQAALFWHVISLGHVFLFDIKVPVGLSITILYIYICIEVVEFTFQILVTMNVRLICTINLDIKQRILFLLLLLSALIMARS